LFYLDVDREQYVTPYIQDFIATLEAEKNQKGEGHGNERAKFINLLKNAGEGAPEEEKVKLQMQDLDLEEVKQENFKIKVHDPQDFSGKIEKLSNSAEKSQKVIEDALKKKAIIRECSSLLRQFKVESYEDLKSIGFDTNEKLLVFIIQTILHHKNADRRDAIQKGKLIDSFNQEACVNFLKAQYVSTVNSERESEKQKIRVSFESDSGYQDGLRFSATEDLFEAAGMLHKTLQGSLRFRGFYKSLQKEGIPHPIEKIKMLMTGGYMKVPLITDKIQKGVLKQGNFIIWNPKKKNVYRFWTAHYKSADLNEWECLFPKFKEYLDRQELRHQGKFVASKAEELLKERKIVNAEKRKANIEKQKMHKKNNKRVRNSKQKAGGAKKRSKP